MCILIGRHTGVVGYGIGTSIAPGLPVFPLKRDRFTPVATIKIHPFCVRGHYRMAFSAADSYVSPASDVIKSFDLQVLTLFHRPSFGQFALPDPTEIALMVAKGIISHGYLALRPRSTK